MKTTTESDIPELFRQFSGNSANYQELTRAAAARASQARWPLLSAVELEQGDIPSVIDRETGLTVSETKPQQATTAVGEPAADDTEALPFAVLTEIIPDAAPTTGELLALAKDEGVSLSTDEIMALVDIGVHPAPVIVPGTNTIFMAPAPFSARHFAQVERALTARREAALAAIPVQVDVNEAVPSEAPAQADVADAAQFPNAATDSAVAAIAEHQPATATAPWEAAAPPLAALSAERSATHPQEAAAPITEVARVEMPRAAPQVQVAVSAPRPAPAPKVVETALPTQVTPAVAMPMLKIRPATARTPDAVVPAVQAKPVSPPILRAAVAAPDQPKVAAQTPLRTPAPATAAPQSPAPPTDELPVKHAGLKPLFERLAAPEETASPVKSLFSRLLQS